MKLRFIFSLCVIFSVLFYYCESEPTYPGDSNQDLIELTKGKRGGGGGGGGGGGHTETAGNNLSFPVIWAPGDHLTPRGTDGQVPLLEGEWWYVWGSENSDPPQSCPPDLTVDYCRCADGVTIPDPDWVKVYLQKDELNVWQAYNRTGSGSEYLVNYIDWGDNLESVDWYTRSQVRTEVVLYRHGSYEPEYKMRHVSGWGIDEVHGLVVEQSGAVVTLPGDEATVYSEQARLTIQKKTGDDLTWDPAIHCWTGDVNIPIFNQAIYEHAGVDGPGYYSAEVNVKGKVIFGYTWNVRNMNQGPGTYRISFSFDNGDFFDGSTTILPPLEGEDADVDYYLSLLSGEPGGGGDAEVDWINQLTYIDVEILDRTGGGGGGGGGRP